MNRRSQPIHRRKRKADTPPCVDEEDRESTAGPEEKRTKLVEPEGQCFIVLRLCITPPAADDSVTPPPSEHGGETVELQIRPHPDHSNLTDTAIKNLATSPLCTVSHLLRFIQLNTATTESGVI